MPEQIVVCDAAIEIAGVTLGVTAIETTLLVAVTVVKHVALLVMAQVTVFPLVNVEELKDELLVPAFMPFTCH